MLRAWDQKRPDEHIIIKYKKWVENLPRADNYESFGQKKNQEQIIIKVWGRKIDQEQLAMKVFGSNIYQGQLIFKIWV